MRIKEGRERGGDRKEGREWREGKREVFSNWGPCIVTVYTGVTVAGEDADCVQCEGTGGWYLCAGSLRL